MPGTMHCLPRASRSAKADRPLWAVLLAALLAGATVADVRGQDGNSGMSYCLAHDANMAALKRFKCKYVLTKGQAKSVQDALDGRITSSKQCEYIYVVDSGSQRFQSLTPLDVTPPKNLQPEPGVSGRLPGASYTVVFSPVAELIHDGDCLSYFAPWNQVNIGENEEKPPASPEYKPLSSVGWQMPLGLGHVLSFRDEWRATVTSAGARPIRGQPTVQVGVSGKGWGSGTASAHK